MEEKKSTQIKNTSSLSDTIKKKEPLESTTASKGFILILCLLYRWWNAYMTRTFDNPDEYWQGNEIAHRLVFGYGYVTWEWVHQLRSFFHPLLLASVYKLIAFLRLDHHYWIMNHILNYFQASLSAAGDLFTFTLAKKLYGNDIAPYILFVILSSWFQFLMAPRTLSNTLETILTMIAMSYWPFPGLQYNDSKSWLSQYRLSLFWAALACITRPTNGLIWLFLGIQLLYHHYCIRSSLKHCWIILWNAFMITSLLFMINSLIDTYFYNHYHQQQQGGKEWWFNSILADPTKIIFVPWTFLKINVFQSIAVFYGMHPFHWYLSQGLPLMLLTFLPFTCIGFYKSMKSSSPLSQSSLCGLIIWTITIYSLLSHKEFRFLYPIFPVLLMMTSYGLKTTCQSFITHKKWNLLIIFGLWSSQFLFSIYFNVYHQRGIMDMMTWLQRQQADSIGFLMPCHSTPWQSMMHRPNTLMWFLTCEPPLNNSDINPSLYMDQADQFYHDPLHFLSTQLKHNSSSLLLTTNDELLWPTYLVMFDHLLQFKNGTVKDYLMVQQNYSPCHRFFNSHFHWDSRRKGDVVIMCKF